MAMVTSPEHISNSGKKMRRQWKSFNTDRNNSIPGDSTTTWESPFRTSNSNNMTPRDDKPGEEKIFPPSDYPEPSTYGRVSHALRAQMAEGGSGDAQLAMAREMLMQVAAGDAVEETVDKIQENAMYWLVRAARQGEREAVDTVRSLAKEGKGVTDYNYCDVDSVVDMSCDDLIGNKIGQVLFSQMAEGRDFVTVRQLARIGASQEGESLGGNSRGSRQKITRMELASAGREYMQGEVPAIDEVITLPDRASLLNNSTAQNILLTAGIVMVIKLLITSLLKQALCITILVMMVVQTISLSKASYHCRRYLKWSLICSSAIPGLDCDAQNTKAAVQSTLHISVKYFTCFAVLTIVSSSTTQPPSTIVISLLSFALLSSTISTTKSKTFVITMLIYCILRTGVGLESIIKMNLIPAGYLQPGTLAVATLIPMSIFGLLTSDSVSQLHQLVCISLLDQLLLYLGHSSPCTWPSITFIAFGLLSSLKLAFHHKCHRKLVLLCLFILGALALAVSSPPLPPRPSSLTWATYHQHCLSTPGLTTQVSCLHFNGVTVHWKGSIHQVKILQRRNLIEDISSLPVVVDVLTGMRDRFPGLQKLVCHLGDPYKDCASPQRPPAARIMCQVRNEGSALPCHWERYATYKYGVQVKMTNKLFGDNQLINLQLEHGHGEFCAGAVEGEQLEFTGTLHLAVGDKVPSIVASKIAYV